MQNVKMIIYDPLDSFRLCYFHYIYCVSHSEMLSGTTRQGHNSGLGISICLWRPASPKIISPTMLVTSFVLISACVLCHRVWVQSMWHVFMRWQNRSMSLQARCHWTTLWPVWGERSHVTIQSNCSSRILHEAYGWFPLFTLCFLCFVIISAWLQYKFAWQNSDFAWQNF